MGQLAFGGDNFSTTFLAYVLRRPKPIILPFLGFGPSRGHGLYKGLGPTGERTKAQAGTKVETTLTSHEKANEYITKQLSSILNCIRLITLATHCKLFHKLIQISALINWAIPYLSHNAYSCLLARLLFLCHRRMPSLCFTGKALMDPGLKSGWRLISPGGHVARSVASVKGSY